ncbi:MAG: RNA 2',3'-cyclic phosphodiesterase [Planctomycetes bacterium]|nr:RNA 2',3'-cyclic phosphodiesterase [Planctomycetota bacterium]
MPRLFVALDLPEPVKAGLEHLCGGLPGARWVRDRQFHVTLAFLGEVEGPLARRVAEGLHGVRADPFPLELRGVGHFPPRGTPKVLWVGVDGGPELLALHHRVHSRLERLGLQLEERRFAPHVTLARLVQPPLPELLRFMDEHMAFREGPLPVTDFQLMSSVLGRSGAQHRVEASYPLFARRPG